MHQVDPDIRSRLLTARLPVMPQILLKLIEKCQADDAGMNVLADLVNKDPGMTAKVLGIANSSAYHRAGRPVGLEQALATLGTDGWGCRWSGRWLFAHRRCAASTEKQRRHQADTEGTENWGRCGNRHGRYLSGARSIRNHDRAAGRVRPVASWQSRRAGWAGD